MSGQPCQMRAGWQALADHFLGSGAGAIKEPHHRNPFAACDLDGTLFLATMHESVSTAFYREVLSGDANGAAGYCAEAKYDTVRGGHFVYAVRNRGRIVMRRKLAVLAKTSVVEKLIDSLTNRQLATRPLFCDARLSAEFARAISACLEFVVGLIATAHGGHYRSTC